MAACADGSTAIEAVKAHRPGILGVDLRMSPRNGFDVLRALAKERLPCRTVLLTAAITDEEVVEAMRLGATGLVLKEASPDELLDCVRRVHRGEQWIERETVTQAFN